jgi:hypothetical protein
MKDIMELIKQLVALNENASSEGDSVYFVSVRANVWDGRYYDYRTAPVKVVASSEEEAMDIVAKYPKAAMEFLHNVKVRSGNSSRYLIPHKEDPSKNVFISDKHKPVKASKLGISGPAVKVLNRNGELTTVKANDGKVE